MSNKATVDYFRSRGLAPFQAEFARDFCAADSPSYWELVAPAGMGKTFLSHSIVAYQMESGARMVLVLAPRAQRAPSMRGYRQRRRSATHYRYPSRSS